MKRISGIYGIKCEATGKWYVGASLNVHTRMREHLAMIKRGGPPLYEDGILYADSIKAEAIEYIDDPSQLQAAEEYWIEELQSLVNGYNRQSSRINAKWRTDG